MTLIQLRYFLAVCQYENITRAAELLHVSQPSVSNAIRNLEDELGLPLFYRVKLRLYLTMEGEIFRQGVETMFEDMDRLVERMHELGNNRKLVRIGIPPMTGATIFPPILIAFQKQYPDVRVVVQEHGALRCRELVESDELDLAIAITNGVDPGQFNSIGIVDTRILFCVSASHPLAARERVTPEECCREPLVMMPAGSYVRQVVEQMYRARNLKPNVLLHSSQILTMMNLIREQAAAAFMIENLIRRTPGLVGIPTNPPLDMLHIGLIWKRNKTLYSDVTRFIRFARSYSDNLRR